MHRLGGIIERLNPFKDVEFIKFTFVFLNVKKHLRHLIPHLDRIRHLQGRSSVSMGRGDSLELQRPHDNRTSKC